MHSDQAGQAQTYIQHSRGSTGTNAGLAPMLRKKKTSPSSVRVSLWWWWGSCRGLGQVLFFTLCSKRLLVVQSAHEKGQGTSRYVSEKEQWSATGPQTAVEPEHASRYSFYREKRKECIHTCTEEQACLLTGEKGTSLSIVSGTTGLNAHQASARSHMYSTVESDNSKGGREDGRQCCYNRTTTLWKWMETALARSHNKQLERIQSCLEFWFSFLAHPCCARIGFPYQTLGRHKARRIKFYVHIKICALWKRGQPMVLSTPPKKWYLTPNEGKGNITCITRIYKFANIKFCLFKVTHTHKNKQTRDSRKGSSVAHGN